MTNQQQTIIANATRSEVENVPDIQSLTARAHELSQKADFWNGLMVWALVAAAIAAAVVVITTRMALVRAGQLSDVQEEIIASVNQKAGAAIEHAGKLENDNLVLRSQVATLEISAGSTAKDLLSLQKAADDAKSELAKQQTRAANAERETAETQLALKKASELAATPRHIIMGNRNNDQEIRAVKLQEVGKYADTPAIIIFVPDEEAATLAAEIKIWLGKAGWKSVSLLDLGTAHLRLGTIREGVYITTLQRANGNVPSSAPISGSKPPEVVNALIDLLNLDLGEPTGAPFGVSWTAEAIINGKPIGALLADGFQIPDNGVVITVGRKPAWLYFWALPQPAPKK